MPRSTPARRCSIRPTPIASTTATSDTTNASSLARSMAGPGIGAHHRRDERRHAAAERRVGARWARQASSRRLRGESTSARRRGDRSVPAACRRPKDFDRNECSSARPTAGGREDRDVGLCNVTVHQIVAAQSIVKIASVQVSLSPFDDESLRNGVAEHCRDNGIRLIAHRPLGGDRAKQLARNPALSRHGNEALGVQRRDRACMADELRRCGRANSRPDAR